MGRVALFCALLGALGIARADIGVNIFGASYHFERDKAKELGLTNEVNPGLGLRWREPWRESFDVFADVGFYRDSARNDAVFAGGGLFWKPTGGLRRSWPTNGAASRSTSSTSRSFATST